MGAERSPAWWVGFAGGLRAMAVWWGAVMDSGQVRLVVRAAPERRNDVVNGVGSRSLADVANASVAPQDTSTEALPVRWEWGTAVASHAPIVPRRVCGSVRRVGTSVAGVCSRTHAVRVSVRRS